MFTGELRVTAEYWIAKLLIIVCLWVYNTRLKIFEQIVGIFSNLLQAYAILCSQTEIFVKYVLFFYLCSSALYQRQCVSDLNVVIMHHAKKVVLKGTFNFRVTHCSEIFIVVGQVFGISSSY